MSVGSVGLTIRSAQEGLDDIPNTDMKYCLSAVLSESDRDHLSRLKL